MKSPDRFRDRLFRSLVFGKSCSSSDKGTDDDSYVRIRSDDSVEVTPNCDELSFLSNINLSSLVELFEASAAVMVRFGDSNIIVII